MRTDCSSRFAAWPYCLSKSRPRPLEERIASFEIERFGRQPHGRFHILRAGVEFVFRLRRLIAREISQQHLLGLIFQRHAQRIFLQEHLLGRQFGAQLVDQIPGAVLARREADAARRTAA